MTHINRRTFLGTGAASLLALSTSSKRARAAAPSERVRLGVIGVRGRGTELAEGFCKGEGAEVVALCDIDDAAFARPLGIVEKLSGKAPRVEKDFRKLLDDKGIDAVVVATPDHWHAILTVMACQAGKDVYVEKPVSHNVVEGRKMVEAARKYGRIVQAGTQRRSAGYVREAVGHVHSGAIGKVAFARAWHFRKREPIGRGKVGPVPEGVDYAMWQGPAPDRPFMANRFHYNWHWFWNWGTGELGNNGIHCVDVCRWGLKVDAPIAVSSGGGKYILDDDQEVPDTQFVTWDFPEASLVYEHRMWSERPLEGADFGMAFYGENGTVLIDSKGWRVEDGAKAGGPATDPQAAHLANFLACVKSREAPNAEIETGHLSTRLCHLGNIAHRVGRRLTFDAGREAFVEDAEADKLLTREYGPRFRMPQVV